MAGGEMGGAEQFFERLVVALSPHYQLIIALKPNQPKRIARLRNLGMTIYEINFGGFFDFQTKSQLTTIITQEQPQLILSFMNRATKFCAAVAKKFNIPVIGRLGGYYDMKYYQDCQALIGNTRGIVAYLQTKFPREKTHYISNFIAETTGTSQADLRQNYADNSVILGSMGRFHANKAFDILLKTMQILPHNFHLLLAGDGELKPQYQEFIKNHDLENRVHLLGWRNDIQNILASCDIYVSSARIEPLGNTILEAWFQKIPIVACAADGPKELITDGQNGILAKIDDADDLAKKILQCAENQEYQAKLTQNGYKNYQENFSQHAIINQYRGLIDSCVA